MPASFPLGVEGLASANESREILALIAAVADNGMIGRNGALPWNLPDDLRHFRRVTQGKPVIMGRKTFLSIGSPLSKRTNIVLTRDLRWSADGVIVAHSFDAALLAAQQSFQSFPAASGGEIRETMVIGGADLFALALPHAQRLYLTQIHLRPQGDVYFPPYNPDDWREAWRQAGDPDDQGRVVHEFVLFERKKT